MEKLLEVLKQGGVSWRICKAFYAQKPETKLSDFLRMNATEIFNQSNYKPE